MSAVSPEVKKAMARLTNKHNNQLVGAVVADTNEKGKKVKKTTEKLPDFVLMDNDDIFEARIQINSNEFKRWLISCDSNLIVRSHMITDDVSEEDKELDLVRSRFNIFDLLNDGKSCGWIDHQYSASWAHFIQLLRDFEKKFQEKFKSSDKTTTFRFGILPYVFVEGMELVTYRNEVPISCVVTSCEIKNSFFGTYVQISGKILYYSGKRFEDGEVSTKIPAYNGEQTLAELGVKNLAHYPETRLELVNRGKKYVKTQINGPAYVSYKGNITRRGYWTDVIFPATGRIMIDRLGMTNIDPEYNMYFGIDRYRGCEDESQNTNDTTSVDDITEAQYLVMSPYCYGFSFQAKQWGEFVIDNVEEIQYRSDAYDNLVLDGDIKNIMFSLVEYQEAGKDLIDNKGGGCIFLLHGSPGVGKTLTAEAISETLHRPLYMVSVGELGTSVSELDTTLRNILQIAASWNAVLLIDEVDIFLEKRDLDIERNALVGVFLRLLEYYSGILFMTTNRVEHIDPAFYSRISLAVKYPELSISARKQIWTKQLSLYGLTLKDKQFEKLAKTELNGRQIKNCVRIVNSLSARKKETPVLEDFLIVVRQIENFNKVLSGEE